MAINLDSGFEIIYLSDMKYNEMTVEIQYKGQQVAQINKYKGVDKTEIDIYSEYVTPEFMSEFKLPVSEFLAAINLARKALKNA
jgi:ribosomal protein S8